MHLLCIVHDSQRPNKFLPYTLVAKVLMGSNSRVCYTTLVNNGQRICVARECKQHCTGVDWCMASYLKVSYGGTILHDVLVLFHPLE